MSKGMNASEERFLAQLEEVQARRKRPKSLPPIVMPAAHPRDLYDPQLVASREGITEVRRVLSAQVVLLNEAVQKVTRNGTRTLQPGEDEKLATWQNNLRWIRETLHDLKCRYAELDAGGDIRMREFSRQFVYHAKRTLDTATFEAIAEKAEKGALETIASQEARRKLGVGAAIGVGAGVAPMKERES